MQAKLVLRPNGLTAFPALTIRRRRAIISFQSISNNQRARVRALQPHIFMLRFVKKSVGVNISGRVKKIRVKFVTFASSTVQQSAVERTSEHRPTPDLGTQSSSPGHEHSYEPIVLTHSALGWHLQRGKASKQGSRQSEKPKTSNLVLRIEASPTTIK